MRSSIRLVRIAGIDIGIHYSWIFIFILVAWSLAEGYFPEVFPDWSRGTYWITGIVAAIMLFVSVLLHELAHSIVARARGMPVHSITLFLFGGVSNLEKEPEQAGAEFAMAIVGPGASLVLAGIFWGVWYALPGEDTPLVAIFAYLAWINALLAGFNLLPAFPLDGGRVLRSIIWGISGSLKKATNAAALMGTIFGWGLIAFGVYRLLEGYFLGGIWIAFIGWFLSSAADAGRQQVTLREHLSGFRVKEFMDTSTGSVTPQTSVGDVIRDIFLGRHHRAVPVCGGGRMEGILTIADVKKVPQERWESKLVGEVMTRDPIYSVSPDDSLSRAFELINEHDINQVPVLENGRCVGMITRARIMEHIEINRELGV